MEPPLPNTVRSLSRLVGPIMIAGAMSIVAVWIGLLAKSIYDFKTSIRDFPVRRVEAREAIEFIYSHHARHGRWPTLAEIQSKSFASLSNGWQCSTDGRDGAPTMWLRGPYHMSLGYFFEPPQQDKLSDEWRLSIEGDKRYFKEEVPYRVR